jgi:hypothetical protein
LNVIVWLCPLSPSRSLSSVCVWSCGLVAECACVAAWLCVFVCESVTAGATPLSCDPAPMTHTHTHTRTHTHTHHRTVVRSIPHTALNLGMYI